MILQIYYKREPSEKRTEHFLVVYDPASANAHRFARNRGFDIVMTWRGLTHREVHFTQSCKRLRAEAYTSWESLILTQMDDLGVDHPFIRELEDLYKSKRYPANKHDCKFYEDDSPDILEAFKKIFPNHQFQTSLNI